MNLSRAGCYIAKASSATAGFGVACPNSGSEFGKEYVVVEQCYLIGIERLADNNMDDGRTRKQSPTGQHFVRPVDADRYQRRLASSGQDSDARLELSDLTVSQVTTLRAALRCLATNRCYGVRSAAEDYHRDRSK